MAGIELASAAALESCSRLESQKLHSEVVGLSLKATRRIARFDYVGAYAHIFRELQECSGDYERRASLADLCARIAYGHGCSLEDQFEDDQKIAGNKTLERILPHYLAQLEEEANQERVSLPAEKPLFKVEYGWEADVFLSERRSYLKSVLKIYRFHCLGSNPQYPGYGWIIDPQLIEQALFSGSPLPALPDKHFAPADCIDKLFSRFSSFGAFPVCAPTIRIWKTEHALCLEQERVIPLREFPPSEIFYATSRFLTQHCGVYFNNPSIETAVILQHKQFCLLQDYINNLAYRLDQQGNPDPARPVIFDGHLMPISPRYLELFPSLAQAVLMIDRLYPDAPHDRAMVELARQSLSRAAISDSGAQPPVFQAPFAP